MRKIKLKEIRSKFTIQNRKNYVANSTLWRKYVEGVDCQINDLGWKSVWGREHTQRGILIKGLAPLLKKKEHIYIEYLLNGEINSGRVDLMLTSGRKIIDEIWELKDRINFITLNLNDCDEKIESSIDRQLLRLKKTHDFWHSQTTPQINSYKEIFKEKDFKLKSSFIVFFSRLVIVPLNLNKGNLKKLSAISKLINSEIAYYFDEKAMHVNWCPINEKLITFKNYNQKNEDKTPFFTANHSGKNQIKLYLGALVTITKS